MQGIVLFQQEKSVNVRRLCVKCNTFLKMALKYTAH